MESFIFVMLFIILFVSLFFMIIAYIGYSILKKRNIEKVRSQQIIEQNRKSVEYLRNNAINKINNIKDELIKINYRLINKIKVFTEEKPCPKCNELELDIISVSPNARSVSVQCRNCKFEYRIKMDGANPEEIKELYDNFRILSNATNDMGREFGIKCISYPYWYIEVSNKGNELKRSAIPSNIKKEVWNRDGGKCVNCGSTFELQFDHIIPLSRGGSSVTANLQILCKTCNLKKHTSIE
jgi:hypothetical protein